jgi:proline dehydrogenase
LVRGRKDPDGGARFSSRAETDKAFIRCARALIRAEGHPCFATRQSKLIDLIRDLALRNGREPDSFEFGFDAGQRESEQRRLLEAQLHVRVSLTAAAELLGGVGQ